MMNYIKVTSQMPEVLLAPTPSLIVYRQNSFRI